MNRITERMIQAKIDYLNQITGKPTTSYTRRQDNTLKANIGNFHLYQCLGVVALHQMYNEGGGVMSILSGSTKREMYDQLSAFVSGIETQINLSNKVQS